LCNSCKRNYTILEPIYREVIEKERNGDLKGVQKILESKIRRTERDAAYYFFHGRAIYFRSEVRNALEAIEDFKLSYKLEKHMYPVIDIIGDAYYNIKDYKNALVWYKRAVEHYTIDVVNGHMPQPHVLIADIYIEMGKFDDALMMNDKAIEFGIYLQYCYMQRGLILSHINDDIEALNFYYQKAKEIDADITLRDYGNRLLEMGYYQEAYNLCVELLDKYEDIHWCYLDMGYIAMMNNQWEEAQQLIGKAKLIRTDDATLHKLSLYYFFTNNLKEAYNCDALSRVYSNPEPVTFEAKSVDEFIEYNKWDVLFQQLLEKYGTPEESFSN
jgi:tetratricopeptide (TPR) repeat protein